MAPQCHRTKDLTMACEHRDNQQTEVVQQPESPETELAQKIAHYHDKHASYLPFAIFVTLFCALGAIGIFMVCSENKRLAQGDLAGAERAHKAAKLCCWLGLFLGLLSAPVAFFIL